MKKIAFGTLGCKLNQFESDSLVSDFIQNGYEVVAWNQKADVYIVNTCTVTNKSDAKSRNLINKVNRVNQNALLFVTGCYAETDPKALEKIDGVNYLVGNELKYDLFNIVDNIIHGKDVDIKQIKPDRFRYNSASKTLHTRAFLKIQDGCDEHCSYCKIPIARGKAESRPFNDVLENVKNLIEFGYKEIILTGINIGDYNFEEENLSSLLNEILNIKQDFRVHLSSIEPNKVDSSLMEVLENPKLCKHLHIPLQSGSDRILSLMERNYSVADFESVIAKVLSIDERINITTDIMLGFPTETEDDFQDTLSLVKALSFSHVHTFKYSIRDGTVAGAMKTQVPEKIKSERSEALRKVSSQQNLRYRQQFLNKTLRVLTEKEVEKGIYSGHSDHYVKIHFSGDSAKIGEFIDVRINEVDEGYTKGEAILT